MFGKSYKAGVSYSSNHAQIAVLEFRKEEISLIHLQEIANDQPGEHWYLRPLITKSNKVYKKVASLSLAFDNASVEFHFFPMDTTLSREEQQEHTHWEMSKLISGYVPKEHLLDVHTMKTRTKEHIAETFVVAARRAALQTVQTTLNNHRIGLDIADINFFGGQYALLVNYPEVRGKNIAIVEVGTSRIDMGLLSFARLAAFRYDIFATPQECVAAIDQFLESQRVAEIYLYGEGLSLEMQETIAQHAKIPLVRINPFRRIQVGKDVPGYDSVSGNEHRFAPAIGVALRRR